MLSSALRRLFQEPSRLPARAYIPDGQRVYAIGDVHGRADLLENLLGEIERDDAGRPAAQTTIVLLGDLVDRGPHSRQVIDRLLDRDWGARAVRYLLGNHEEVMLRALAGDLEIVRFWMRIGGAETMTSYGVDAETLAEGSAQKILDAFIPNVPRGHQALLHRMEDRVSIGDYCFVHAGIRPGVALERQQVEDLRWIRREFLDFEGDHGAVIVHGHTVTEDVEEFDNRIGIDTGAYRTGRLSALGLEGSARWRLAT